MKNQGNWEHRANINKNKNKNKKHRFE